MSSLTERLHAIILKLRRGIDRDLPDPATLPHAGEITVRGHNVTVRSSVPLGDIGRGDVITLYLHQKPTEAEMGTGLEVVRYFHFESRADLSSIYIVLTQKDGDLRQSVNMRSLPREVAMANIETYLGRGGPRPRRGGTGGRGMARLPPPPMDDSDASME